MSFSSELKSFLFSMCIDAPESTTNSRSFVARFRLVTSPQTWARNDYALEVRTFESLLAMETFFPVFKCGAMCPLRN